MILPLALLIASFVTSCLSYSNAERLLADDLNEAITALAKDNSEIWTRQDTIAALRQMHAATHKPIIYQASDVNFKNELLRDEAFYILSLVDNSNVAQKMKVGKLVSDSILLVPEKTIDGVAVRIQGFADCSMASIFSVSDQTLPGVLLSMSILSLTAIFVWRPKQVAPVIEEVSPAIPSLPSLDGIKLTPMQRKFTQMLLEAPGMKVDKSILCAVLWDNKSNAEESLYTLVRRTKAALADSNLEIVCNRGDSYELHVKQQI